MTDAEKELLRLRCTEPYPWDDIEAYQEWKKKLDNAELEYIKEVNGRWVKHE